MSVEKKLVEATSDYNAMLFLINRGIILCKVIPDPSDGYWYTVWLTYSNAVKAYQAAYP